MSGIDPLLAMSARVAAAEAALLEAAINLGASAEILQAQISIGDVLAAKVLPPQNGQDFIELLGQRVAAQLPPGVHPGETLLLQVTGFAGQQIYVRNLGTPDPQNPLPVSDAVLQPAQSQSPQTAQPAQEAQQAQQAPSQQPAVSPPRAVFVAASVRPAAPPQPVVQTQAPQQSPTPVHGVEARIAAAQAAKPAPTQPAPLPQAQRTLPPLIPQREVSAHVAVVKNAVQRAVQTVSEFLRAARLPDTPFTRMAATIAQHAPERLPSVLQRLEATLPRAAQDERIPTLRTLIAFTSRLNPTNAETLRAQISAYVSNVVEGVEAKVAQLLQAHTQTAQPVQTASEQAVAQQPQHQTQDAVQLPPTLAQARAAERAAAISHDLKGIVLSLLRDPPAERTPAMTQALTETLITLTGVQVNALSSNQQTPGTINLTLPVYYHEGGKPAQIRISRDAESRAGKMDADNFHVAFVLDTANLGTVAIDLQTTGRTVKIDVKTESSSAAHRFSDTLSALRARLEDLRYRVASTVASALKNDTVQPPGEARAEKKRGLDLQA